MRTNLIIRHPLKASRTQVPAVDHKSSNITVEAVCSLSTDICQPVEVLFCMGYEDPLRR